MPFDGVVTKAIVEELEAQIIQGRVTKIHQPSPTEIILTIRKNRTNYPLLISIHPSYARFHITNEKYQNPIQPPMFCMVLRKHLQGAFIEAIEQEGLERMVTFRFRAIDEIHDTSHKYLVVEIMGRHSNVILLNEQREHIIDSLKHVPPSQNRYRTILPGSPYKAPPAQDKLDPLTIDGEDFLKRIDFNAGKIDQQIVRNVNGFSPVLAKEITTRAALGAIDAYRDHFLEIRTMINRQDYTPTIYRDQKEDFHVIPLSSMPGEQETYSSVSQMLDTYYAGKAERDLVKQQAGDLKRLLTNERDKNIRKLRIHEKTLKHAKNADKYQRLGELLTAHLHLVKQGDPSVTVVDYYDPEQNEVTINLQPDKTPSENAQAYFTRYRKLSTSKEIVQQEIKKTEKEIAYLEQLLQQLEDARVQDLDEIREELREEGYLKKQQKTKVRKTNRPQPEQYLSSDGTTIYVGKNNKQNEYVTHRLANRHDIWLHTKDIPGSHVVIKSNNPSEQTLLEAAQLAAYFSKARQSSSVPVDYTQIKYVKKPNGAKPGFVIYEQQKTLFVTPDKKVVESLKNNKQHN